jgi:hypothetical protein
MTDNVASQPRKRIASTVVLQSRWVTLYKDHLLSNGGYELEYLRVDRSDSVIVLVRQAGKFVLPKPQFRPGIGGRTLDFPGGRIDGTEPAICAELTVRRELQLEEKVHVQLDQLTVRPLYVDSAFSSQEVFGFVSEIPEGTSLQGKLYTTSELMKQLQCLQCRAMLLEWRYRTGN